jgi:drug/metabolite transporter (DMT)-like permease
LEESRATGRGRTLLFTGVALVAFAANSILCRLALGPRLIDPASFAAVRLASGALMLGAIGAALRRPSSARPRAGWASAGLLFLYAAAFSFAYTSLSAGTGALILFGAVQITMILAALRSGERFRAPEGVGLALALGGLAYLVSPGIAAPSALGSALMAVAGASWGVYSLRGRGAGDPLHDTAGNFLRAVPLAAAVSAITLRGAHVSAAGTALAATSGALASGLGYVAWYAALRGLTAIRAATVQLAVPVLAALGGVAFLSERITVRLVFSAVLILGGVALAVLGHRALFGQVEPAPVD